MSKELKINKLEDLNFKVSFERDLKEKTSAIIISDLEGNTISSLHANESVHNILSPDPDADGAEIICFSWGIPKKFRDFDEDYENNLNRLYVKENGNKIILKDSAFSNFYNEIDSNSYLIEEKVPLDSFDYDSKNDVYDIEVYTGEVFSTKGVSLESPKQFEKLIIDTVNKPEVLSQLKEQGLIKEQSLKNKNKSSNRKGLRP